MSAMNLATQRRKGVLYKTPDMLTYTGHIYGNDHGRFKGRRPTPTSEGFFGLGSASLYGDGKMHYYGNDEGQTDLPPNGFYGLSGSDMDYQVADMMIPGGQADDRLAPSPTMGNYMDAIPTTNNAKMIYVLGAGLAAVWYFRR